jgi:CTP:molybdopterin cytidylyltransferase MocA
MAPSLTGIILAAGASSRMGRPKALLPLADSTFVSRIAKAMRDGSLTHVVAVTAPDLASDVQATLAHLAPPPVRMACNPNPDRGQLSSLLVGLDAAEQTTPDGVIVCPVDVPLFAPSTVAALVAAAQRPGLTIARPAWRGRHGHPVLFMRGVFDELRQADLSAGARAVVRAHGADLTDLEIDDPGAYLDVDTPEEYEAIRTAAATTSLLGMSE